MLGPACQGVRGLPPTLTIPGPNTPNPTKPDKSRLLFEIPGPTHAKPDKTRMERSEIPLEMPGPTHEAHRGCGGLPAGALGVPKLFHLSLFAWGLGAGPRMNRFLDTKVYFDIMALRASGCG